MSNSSFPNSELFAAANRVQSFIQARSEFRGNCPNTIYVVSSKNVDFELSTTDLQLLCNAVLSAGHNQLGLTEAQRTAPEKIWLHLGDLGDIDMPYDPTDDITWADQSIGENSIPYVREDLVVNAPVNLISNR